VPVPVSVGVVQQLGFELLDPPMHST
jgi:hypothetical protein